MIDRQTTAHYIWGEGCDGWRLVQSPALSVIEERMPPGTSEMRHYHQKAVQFFYVLGGTLTIEVGGQEHTLQSRQGARVDAGVAHQVFNRSEGPVEFLVISQPPSH